MKYQYLDDTNMEKKGEFCALHNQNVKKKYHENEIVEVHDENYYLWMPWRATCIVLSQNCILPA